MVQGRVGVLGTADVPRQRGRQLPELTTRQSSSPPNHPSPRPTECDHIVGLAKPHMERSGVVDTSTGGSEISDIRTSKVGRGGAGRGSWHSKGACRTQLIAGGARQLPGLHNKRAPR